MNASMFAPVRRIPIGGVLCRGPVDARTGARFVIMAGPGPPYVCRLVEVMGASPGRTLTCNYAELGWRASPLLFEHVHMPNYRRPWIPGATCFFTVNLWNRESHLLVEHIELLRAAFRDARAAQPFSPIAMVVLPDHLHCLWSLPEGDADNASRWQRIKSLFTRSLPVDGLRSASRIGKRERGIWQRRYFERVIVDELDLRAHIDYIHYNPVKHGHVQRAIDWPHSSFHRYVQRGLLLPEWGTSMAAFAHATGEARTES